MFYFIVQNQMRTMVSLESKYLLAFINRNTLLAF